MKRIYAVALFFCILVVPLTAQDQNITEILTDLSITDEEAVRIGEIQAEYLEEVRLPQAELEVVRARLTRELVKSSPSMEEIEKILQEGIPFEVELRLAEIRRELAMRELLGDQRWARFKRIVRFVRERGGETETLLQRLQHTRPETARTLRIIQQYGQ